MKIGVLTLMFGAQPLETVLPYLQSLGVQAVEFGTGAYLKTAHFPTEELLDASRAKALKELVQSRGLTISALSCHGNPLHPSREIAQAHHQEFCNACRLAAELGVTEVNTLSGCPGSDPAAQVPSWIISPLPPDDFQRAWEWQWNEKVLPYWHSAAKIAQQHGVRIGIEMAPNCAVYNVETLLKLRQAVGETIGANLDPSHLFWQGVDIGAAIRKLGRAIFHAHTKDSAVNPYVTAVNGILDAKALTDEANRSWIFRTVGYGHDQLTWRNIVSQLRVVGYDGALSIEHEDSLMSADEGLRKAIDFLQQCLIRDKPGAAYWAQ